MFGMSRPNTTACTTTAATTAAAQDAYNGYAIDAASGHCPGGVTVPAGTYKAIKLDVQLNKIDKKRELEPHKKFRRASVWVSDDPDRLLLRIEASVFIGTVFAELQSVHFADEKP